MRSFEPGEDWWWCYIDEAMFMVDGAPVAASHTEQARLLEKDSA